MLRQLLFGISFSGGLVSAVTTTRYSSTTIVQCRTQSGSGGVAPTPIPTSNGATTVTSIRTEAAVTAPSTVRVNAPTVTITTSTSTTWENTIATVTSSFFTTWVGFDSTVATASWTVTSCTNGVSPSTVTSYTGTYKPVPGQNTALPKVYPTQVFCSTTVSSFLTLFPTSTSGATTITNTPTTTVGGQIIATSTITITWGTDVVYASTLTSTTRRHSLAGRPTTVRTACQPTTTTTLAAKCAPTNIIGSIDNVGLVSGRYAQNISVIYLREDKYLDPSLCCQLCQENEGCGAVMTGMNEFCGLLYVGGPRGNATCDFTFTYGTQANVHPGQGLLVQSGCGSIEYEK